MKERFKILIKDTKTGETTLYNSHSAGFNYHENIEAGEVDLVRIVLYSPRIIKKKQSKIKMITHKRELK